MRIARAGVRCIQGTFIVTELFGNRGSLHFGCRHVSNNALLFTFL